MKYHHIWECLLGANEQWQQMCGSSPCLCISGSTVHCYAAAVAPDPIPGSLSTLRWLAVRENTSMKMNTFSLFLFSVFNNWNSSCLRERDPSTVMRLVLHSLRSSAVQVARIFFSRDASPMRTTVYLRGLVIIKLCIIQGVIKGNDTSTTFSILNNLDVKCRSFWKVFWKENEMKSLFNVLF